MDELIGIRGEFLSLKVDPEGDLRKEIELYCKEKHVKAGTIFNAFGSLTKARLGLPRNAAPLKLNAFIESLGSYGIVKEENRQLSTNVNIIISKDGKPYR